MAYEEAQCKKCGKLHPSFEVWGTIYYKHEDEMLRESLDEYKKRIIED